LLDRAAIGDLPATAAFVVSNNSASGAMDKARAAGIPAYHVSAKTEGSEEAVASRLLALLDEYRPDLLVLAGYMKKVPDAVLARMKNRILNIHPALLPEFGGAGMWGHHVHEAVVRAGKTFSGMTVHMVNGDYDEGQILAQRRVDIPAGTDASGVGSLVLRLEHDTYWRAVKGFADGQIVPTNSDDPSRAAQVSEEWKRTMRNLDGAVFP
jgi:phosphoribosylglycinamide formyltransferase-1